MSIILENHLDHNVFHKKKRKMGREINDFKQLIYR